MNIEARRVTKDDYIRGYVRFDTCVMHCSTFYGLVLRDSVDFLKGDVNRNIIYIRSNIRSRSGDYGNRYLPFIDSPICVGDVLYAYTGN